MKKGKVLINGKLFDADIPDSVQEEFDRLREQLKEMKENRKLLIPGKVAFCEKHDADYWIKTREWISKKCGSRTCGFCAKRPAKHKPHKWQYYCPGKAKTKKYVIRWMVCGK